MFGCVQAKWGPVIDKTEICRIEVQSALTEAKMLPQQPFGNVLFLQHEQWLEPDPEGGPEPVLKGTKSKNYNFKAAQALINSRE